MKSFAKLTLIYFGLIVLAFYQSYDVNNVEQKPKTVFEYQQF